MGGTNYQKMKGGVKNGAGQVKSGAGQVKRDSLVVLGELIIYASTIVIALAWNSFFIRIFPADTIWLLYVYALCAILLAFLVCYVTGESISFGEDCC